MAVTEPPRPDPSNRDSLAQELADMFDRCVIGYYASLDAEEWSAAFEYRELIEHIHNMAERVAA